MDITLTPTVSKPPIFTEDTIPAPVVQQLLASWATLIKLPAGVTAAQLLTLNVKFNADGSAQIHTICSAA